MTKWQVLDTVLANFVSLKCDQNNICMNPTLRNILAVLAGIIIGSIINGVLILMSSSIIPPPEGAILTTEEGLKASMHLMQPKHFIMPFLAHAMGTFFGAWVAATISDNKMRSAYIIGIVFLIGGIANCFMLPAPAWFIIIDLMLAYIPMAYLGGKLSKGKTTAAL